MMWTAILRCGSCGAELNRAEHVPEDKKNKVGITSAFAAGDCPNGCRPTFLSCSDLNINTNLEWIEEADR